MALVSETSKNQMLLARFSERKVKRIITILLSEPFIEGIWKS